MAIDPVQWTAGLAPPQYQEVGPFAFRAKEVRYNMQYDWNWTQVEYTFHQWAEFLPDKSCPACTMDANITSVNRGYLQFLSAPAQGTVNQESAVIYDMMPVTLSVINQSMTAAVDVAQPGSPSLQQDVIKQWTDCSYLEVCFLFFFVFFFQAWRSLCGICVFTALLDT